MYLVTDRTRNICKKSPGPKLLTPHWVHGVGGQDKISEADIQNLLVAFGGVDGRLAVDGVQMLESGQQTVSPEVSSSCSGQ